MGITYAGIELLLPDRNGELCKFLDSYLSIDGMRFFGDRRSDPLPSRQADNGQHGLPIAKVNYPPPPQPRLNSLYWPTGATRFSYGLFLVTRTNKDKIIAAAQSTARSFTKKDLRFTNSADGTELLKTSMYMLEPHPVTTYKDADGKENVLQAGQEALWLLPLVDARYYWDRESTREVYSTASSTTWVGLAQSFARHLFDQVSTDIVMSAPSADYLAPDRVELQGTYGNAAMKLDALAHTVGCRVIRDLDGTLRVMTNSQATATLTANFDKKHKQIAGDEFNVDDAKEDDLPASIRIGARKSLYGRLYYPGGDCEFDDQELLPELVYYYRYGSGATTVGFKDEEIVTTALAYTIDPASAPSNNTNLDTLATKIKTDWYAWRRLRFDHTFASVFGTAGWTMSGAEDYVEYRFGGVNDATKQYEAATRVVAMPPDVGVNTMYHADASLDFGFLDSPQLGKVYDTAINDAASGLVEVFKRDGTASGKRVPAYAWPGLGNGDTNIIKDQPVVLFWMRNVNRWYALPAMPNNVYWGKATANWKKTGGGISGTLDYVPVSIGDHAGDSGHSVIFKSTVDVVLPNDSVGGGDPNIVSGDIVAFSFTSSGEAICVSPYMDARIGTIRLMAVANAMDGWGKADGTENAGPHGSGLDMRTAYLYSGTSPHATESKNDGGSSAFPRATFVLYERLDNSS